MADEEEQEESKSGGSKIIIVIIAVVVVILLIIGGLLAFLLSGDDKPPPNATIQNPQGQGGADGSLPNIQVNKTYLKVGPLYEGLGLLVTNLSSRKGKRYLRVKIDLELDSDSLMGELDSKLPVVKDIILGILGSKSVEDLTTIKGKNRTKQEIMVTLNKSLLDGKITDVFFQEFIIQ